MYKSFNKLVLVSLVGIILLTALFTKAEAFSLGSTANFFRQTADDVTSRVSDIIYYLVMQKKYIFDHYSDPNNFSGNIPADFETKLPVSSVSTTTSKVSDKLVSVTTSTVPNVKKTDPVYKVNPSIQITPVVPVSSNSSNLDNVIAPIETSVSGNNSQILNYTNIERNLVSLKPLMA